MSLNLPVPDSVRPPGSRVLHWVDRFAGRPIVAIAAVTASVMWVVYSAVFGFPSRAETVFQTLVAALTLALVFVIQHTQSRQQVATQRKLDEILLALPRADNGFVALEDAGDATLAAARSTHQQAFTSRT